MQRRTLAATVPNTLPQRRIEVPEWFEQVRADAEESRRVAQQRLDDREAERAATQERVAAARGELPAAQVAHAPFADQVAAARSIVREAQSELRDTHGELRRAGRLHRRTARHDVEAATDVLAVATERLERVEKLAAPTCRRVDELRTIIDSHDRTDSTRRILDRWDNLEGVAHRTNDLCHALDQWKAWANGRNLTDTALADVAATFHDNLDRPGISQLGQPLTQWAQRRGLELQPPTPPTPSIGIEIDF